MRCGNCTNETSGEAECRYCGCRRLRFSDPDQGAMSDVAFEAIVDRLSEEVKPR